MHCDMVKQFVTCLDQRLKANNHTNNEIYVDAWRSLNQRFHQRCVRMKWNNCHCLVKSIFYAPKKLSSLLTAIITIWQCILCSLVKKGLVLYNRLYDPNVDLLRADWSPFHETAWVMPLLTELSGWREKYNEIMQVIYRDRNDTGAHFMADFAGNWALFNL